MIAEHTRAVNKISFHATDPEIIISGSQDGLVKLWDNRTNETSRTTFDAKSESCRDVQFAPTGNPWQFISAYDNGAIYLWDIRSPNTLEKKWSAHNGLVLSVDWHSNGLYFASSGRDKIIHLWDTKAESKKPIVSIQGVQPVAYLKWRPPPLNGSTGNDFNIASYALSNDPR